MESQKNNTVSCTNAKRAVAQYVYDTLKNLPEGLQSITITRQVKSEGCYVTTATTVSSVGIETVTFSDAWLTTSKVEPGGSSQRKRKEKERLE